MTREHADTSVSSKVRGVPEGPLLVLSLVLVTCSLSCHPPVNRVRNLEVTLECPCSLTSMFHDQVLPVLYAKFS